MTRRALTVVQKLGNHKYPVCYATFPCRYQRHDKKQRVTKFCRLRGLCSQQHNVLYPLTPYDAVRNLAKERWADP